MLCAEHLSLTYIPNYLNDVAANNLLNRLLDALHWQPQQLRIYGKWVMTPRSVIWMGDPDVCYTYSGVKHTPIHWFKPVKELCVQLNKAHGFEFNSVLLNRYRTGKEYMGWHRDNEMSLGKNPDIASLSLGAERNFDIRNRKNHCEKQRLRLAHGSLLLMQGETQSHYEHALPKMLKVNSTRINLTFRKVTNH